MDNQFGLKNFICIDYPGLVENEKEAIRTLGGMDRLSQAFSKRNSKLLLNLTPDNIFAKTLASNEIMDSPQIDSETSKTESKAENSGNMNTNRSSDYLAMPCLLLSFKVKTKQTQIIGKIKKLYNFDKMADFQYLPMSSQSNKIQDEENNSTKNQFTYTAFYDQFLFNNVQNYDYELRKNNLPQLFILPPFFSRFDDPVNYSYRSEPNKKQIENKESSEIDSQSVEKSPSKSQKEESSELIRSMRQERSSQALLVSFNTKEIPSQPSEKLKPARTEMIRECISKLKELFEKRPCYLKSVFLCITNYSASILKESLPYVAYYFTTGPWRSCWVRYGYDPRIHPEAKIYQMIDYRLRNTAEPDNLVKSKPRSSYHKRKFRSDLNETDFDEYKTFKLEEEMYKFKPDKLPGSRNVFYQICDIEDEDVQKLIYSEENQSNRCSEKDGWCMTNIQDKCRNIMSQKHEKLSKILSNEQKQEGKKSKN